MIVSCFPERFLFLINEYRPYIKKQVILSSRCLIFYLKSAPKTTFHRRGAKRR